MFNLKLVAIVFAGVLLAACAQEETQETSESDGEAPAGGGQGVAEYDARVCAEEWLAIVDEGKYEKSWKEGAEFFQKSLPKDTWVNMMRTNRSAYGKVVERFLLSRTSTTTLPGAPAGEYVVIEFECTFEHRGTMTETVTPQKEKNGSWKVAAYYIE